jgi:mannose-1-phosphate guanylyltransferase
MDHTYAVIMAGGGGTRLWPISRKKHPKHLLPLLGEVSLFQDTLKRLEGLIPPEHIYIATTAEQEQELKCQAPLIPVNNFLIEPTPRGTASIVGLAATTLLKHDPGAVMSILPSDHFIRNKKIFHDVLRLAVQVARKDFLVTLGIPPSYPSTGYGYIKLKEELTGIVDHPLYRVAQFTEKPDEANARLMITSGDYLWNSGMFIWRADRILSEFKRQMPDLMSALDRIGDPSGNPEQGSRFESEWSQLRSETIDYGIMEHAKNLVVFPSAGMQWSDIGSWDSLFELLQPDKDGNVIVNSLHLPFETHNSLVYSEGKKLVVTIGVDDLIVVDSDDALLVCHRDQAQQVRQVIERLKKQKKEEYL